MTLELKSKPIVKFVVLLAIACSAFNCKNSEKEKIETQENITQETKPNVVFIYLDDLGYGDISANGATEINTPNIDKLANGGVRFTNGYATSATCTPSRYAILTGVYPWRNSDAQILPGTAPLIIDTAQTTVPKMLKKQGYHTGIVGKWHLGLGNGHVNWNERVSPGPNEVGFDYAYIMAATQDRVPTVYIKNGLVDGLDPKDPIEVNYNKNFEGEPTGKDNPELLSMKWHHGHNNSIVNGIPRIGYMKGGELAKWSDVDMADHFLNEAKNYVKQHKNEPFFLYYALQQPHVPRTPHPRFVGKSGMGPRGDVILEADWVIGEFIKTLEKENLLENTMIVFSSDNGPVLNDGYYDDAVEKLGNHTPSGGLRGGKYSLFDAGTHVPFITYWKGKIKPTVSKALVCQVDLLSSIASLVGSDIETKDSQDIIEAFLGESQQGRENLILEAGQKTALRSGDWALIPPYNGNAINKQVNIELGVSNSYQLYNLNDDPGQQNDLANINKEKLDEMIATYENIRGKDKVKIKELELK
ncbi:arylsulfatase [Tamlana sp. 2_MG-2023]|uniref:sulfatase family protein n=1 Tax=unclassified Tamlana TaxID=2614803 RepID=UPI0026E3567D|nr:MULTISPECIES: arylsulfatase [unclassified Tamlana]MDO6761249.1 arylsulfatase [Tamlana sp. 2_MG-2023]MDO6791732.1 arylsulfatase [Tamlana sp. 1_MG-2023]